LCKTPDEIYFDVDVFPSWRNFNRETIPAIKASIIAVKGKITSLEGRTGR